MTSENLKSRSWSRWVWNLYPDLFELSNVLQLSVKLLRCSLVARERTTGK